MTEKLVEITSDATGLTKCSHNQKIGRFLAQILPLSSLVPHVVGTKSGRVCGIASFGSSMTLRQDTVDMSPADSRKCRIEYPCQYVPYHTIGDRQRSEEVLVGNKAVCCRGFGAYNAVVFLHLQVLDKNLVRLREVFAQMPTKY